MGKSVDKVLEVPIDKGIPSEKTILFPGEGNEVPGAMPGDLHVKVSIKEHPVFTRRGADLEMTKKISLLEALTGLNFKLKHLDGTEYTICTAPTEIIGHGAQKVVKERGMPFYQDSMSCGNLIIKFDIEFPKSGSLKKEQIEGLKKLLPGPKVPPVPSEYDLLEDFHEHMRNENPEGGKRRDYDDDDDQRGTHRVECGNQ